MNKLLEATGDKKPKTPMRESTVPRNGNYDADDNYIVTVNKGGYCWLHGFEPHGVNNDSKMCRRRKPGHQVDATKNDRKGGTTFNAPPGFKL